jgi:hypothetical protein
MPAGNLVAKYTMAAMPLTPPPVTLLGIRNAPQPKVVHSIPKVIMACERRTDAAFVFFILIGFILILLWFLEAQKNVRIYHSTMIFAQSNEIKILA